MGNFAQKFQGMRLRLNRIGFRIVDPPDYLDCMRLNLKSLAFALRRHQLTIGNDRATAGQFGDFIGVVRQCIRCDDLDRIEARSVAQVDERQTGLGIAPRTHPAAHTRVSAGRERARKRLFDRDNGYFGSQHALKLLSANQCESMPAKIACRLCVKQGTQAIDAE